MARVGFWTPIDFGDKVRTRAETAIERIDSYFYLGGQKAFVIPAQEGPARAVLMKSSADFRATVLKVISYCTVIIPLIMLIAKVVARSLTRYEVIDVQRELAENLRMAREQEQAIVAAIEARANEICRCQDHPEIVWYAKGNNLVFGLRAHPGYVFKMGVPGRGVYHNGRHMDAREVIDDRFERMIFSKKVCLANGLDLLLLPAAKKIFVWAANAEHPVIVESEIPFQRKESMQEHLYRTLPGLEETTRQLTTFIAKTGFSDVEWRNIPLFDDAPAIQRRRVALIDVEEMESAQSGIFGSGWPAPRRGLIRCLGSREQVGIAIAEADRLGLRFEEIARLRATAEQERTEYGRLQGFYLRNGLTQQNARRALQVDLSTLELNLDEQTTIPVPEALRVNGVVGAEQPITMRQVAATVVTWINHVIEDAPEGESVKGTRHVFIDPINDNMMAQYERLGRPRRWEMTEEERNRSWLKRVIDSLVRHGHLFEQRRDNYGIHLQA